MQYSKPASTHVQAAELAFYRGDREAAYQLVRAALLCDPQSVEAWLWLSKLVEEAARQRECYERILAIDPQNRAAQEGIETLRLKDLLASVQAPALHAQKPTSRQIGSYLVEQKLISAEQLQEALRQQRSLRRRGEYTQLGDILVKNGWIEPRTLARALVGQYKERLSKSASGAAPHFLGEYLIAHGFITTSQLQAVLEEQLRLSLVGQRVALGSLLIRKKFIDANKLQRVLEQQRNEFYSRMGD